MITFVLGILTMAGLLFTFFKIKKKLHDMGTTLNTICYELAKYESKFVPFEEFQSHIYEDRCNWYAADTLAFICLNICVMILFLTLTLTFGHFAHVLLKYILLGIIH